MGLIFPFRFINLRFGGFSDREMMSVGRFQSLCFDKVYLALQVDLLSKSSDLKKTYECGKKLTKFQNLQN